MEHILHECLWGSVLNIHTDVSLHRIGPLLDIVLVRIGCNGCLIANYWGALRCSFMFCFFFRSLYFICMDVLLNFFSRLFSFVCMCNLHAWCLWRTEEGIRSSKTDITIMLISYYVGAGNQHLVLYKSKCVSVSQLSSPWTTLWFSPLLMEGQQAMKS